jgi:hypothetical protein
MWLPYLAVLCVYLIWYLFIFDTDRDEVDPNVFMEIIKGNPVEEITRRLGFVIPDIVEASLLVWTQMFSADFLDLSSRSSWVAWLGSGVTVFGVYWVLEELDKTTYQYKRMPMASAESHWGRTAVVGGIICIALSMVPLYVSNMSYELTGAGTRYGLPLMVGACLTSVGLISLLITEKRKQIIVVSTMVGLAVGFHIKLGNEFRHQWNDQKEIIWQLSWRIPELKSNTLIWFHDEGWRLTRWPLASDENLVQTAPINLMYAPDNHSALLKYWVSPVEEDFERTLAIQRHGEPIVRQTRNHRFSGIFGDNLVVWYAPPSCVYVLSNNMDENYALPPLLALAKSWSNTELITNSPSNVAKPPLSIFGSEPLHDWCYYFQKAELARQFGKWERVVELGNEAIARKLHPNNKGEWMPFIEAYRKLGMLDDAERLIKGEVMK